LKGAGGLFEALTDIIFPPRCPLCAAEKAEFRLCSSCLGNFKRVREPLCLICGIPFISKISENHLCGRCIVERPGFDMAASVYLFEGRLSEAMYRFKYAGKTSLSKPLGDLLTDHHIVTPKYDAIVPVPLHISKLRERGFNQSQMLAVGPGKKLRKKPDPFMIERTRPTPPQAGMNRKERIKNIRGAFKVREGVNVKGKRFLLIDDVFTTGATTSECSKVLKKAGAEIVNVLTLARVVAG